MWVHVISKPLTCRTCPSAVYDLERWGRPVSVFWSDPPTPWRGEGRGSWCSWNGSHGGADAGSVPTRDCGPSCIGGASNEWHDQIDISEKEYMRSEEKLSACIGNTLYWILELTFFSLSFPVEWQRTIDNWIPGKTYVKIDGYVRF